MPNKPIVPCIWLDDQAERAAHFYARVFPRSHVAATSHYPQSGANPSGKPPGSVLTVEFEIAGQRFTALNGGPMFKANPSLSFFVHVEAAEEADKLCIELVEGGKYLMQLGTYPWSERYGWVEDRFGVSWQVMTGPRTHAPASIVPCLMFAGPQHGNAERAMQHYAGIFPDSRVDGVERYRKGEGPEGTVKHGRFVLDGQAMVAMDSHVSHDVTFNEGLSLQVMCEDQATIDHYWAKLSEGGEPGPCGWLKDRFGLSWQIVPSHVGAWLTSGDVEARDRAFAAIMEMKKPDIAALQAAFDG
jgi:predicted 3-demethylubiquinone-9 3-methyltransferase (glyoxalase superfamily)